MRARQGGAQRQDGATGSPDYHPRRRGIRRAGCGGRRHSDVPRPRLTRPAAPSTSCSTTRWVSPPQTGRCPFHRILHRHRQNGAGPYFHVNADDPEAVLFVTQMAIDLHRVQERRGHRPDLLPPPWPQRGGRAVGDTAGHVCAHPQRTKPPATCMPPAYRRGTLTEAEDQFLVERYRESLDGASPGQQSGLGAQQDPVRRLVALPRARLDAAGRYRYGYPRIAEPGHDTNVAPDNSPLQKQVAKILEDRRKMAAGAMPLNWGFAETSPTPPC